MLFDSHAHLTHSLFDNDREAVIKKLCDFDIKVINIGNGLEDSKKTVDLAKKYPNQMWASVGVHPYDIDAFDSRWGELINLAEDKSVVAIGECGLDYFRGVGKESIERQKNLFIKQIELSKTLSKPLIIHARPNADNDAYLDVLNILKSNDLNLKNGNGVAHFFSGSKEIAGKFLDLGFYISFAGPITFSEEYRELVKYVPIDKILAETDSPFAASCPWRGKRNEPAFVEFVVRRIAQWKELDFEEVVNQTIENAKKLFNISFLN